MKVQIIILVACWLHLTASQTCPEGVPIFNCFVDPCTTATCPGNPTATCRSNYCGGCNANFTDSNGNDVTSTCTNTSTTCPGPNGLQYRPGETFTAADGCNTCTCTDTGRALCTLRFCPPPPPTTPLPPVNTTVSTPPTNVTNICTQTAAVSGLCLAYIPRFTYNASTQRCERFIYGGCGGNGNNFETEQACREACGPPVNTTGCVDEDGVRRRIGESFNLGNNPCRPCMCTESGRVVCAIVDCPPPDYRCSDGSRPVRADGFCCPICPNVTVPTTPPVNTTGCVDRNGVRRRVGESFNYGPCSPCYCTPSGTVACAIVDCAPPGAIQCAGGAQPVHMEGFCCPVCPNITVTTPPPVTNVTNVCALTAAVAGFCRGSFPRYSYNASTQRCERFIYGGCGGNENNFETERACQETCAPPLNATTCTVNGRVYHSGQTFRAADGCNTCTCTSTGVAACTEMACLDVCAQTAAETGRCRGYFPRYSYNASTRTCARFIYGGCDGNANNFETEQECAERCSVCFKPKYPPNFQPICDVVIQQWTFNRERRRCEQFTYSPCGEQRDGYNVFRTQEECNNRCGRYSNATTTCTNGKVFEECGTACPTTCENRNSGPRPCPAICRQGCFCPQGMVEYNGGCVAPSDCPATTCTNGKVFETCGTACPLTCENYRDSAIPCTDQCVQGCFCPRGMVESNGQCVAPSDCPATTCTNGKVFEECGTACPTTCENRNSGPRICPAVCRQGCFCPQGMVEYNGGCVAPSDCPATTCTNGKVFETCGTACPLTCDNYQNAAAIPCTLQCVQGCFCPQGMLESNGQCVAPSDCPTTTVCTDHNGRTHAVGESFRSEDGCNTCSCTASGNAICTLRACIPVSCNLKDITLDHKMTYDDDCSSCQCQFGRLNCTRKECPAKPDKRPTKVTMKFRGDLDEIAPTKEHQENLKGELKKTMVLQFGPTLGLSQDQFTSIEVKKGSVIFIITLSDADSTSPGANLTILISQVQQHYMSGEFVIEYNSQVLEPSGDFQVEEPEDDEDGFPWWGILMTSVGGVLIVLIVVVLIAVVILFNKTGSSKRSRMSAVNNHYVTYKAEQDDVDVKQPFS